MSARRKYESRRHFVAVTFLSNISLDGTHNDTKFGALKKSGILSSWTRESLKGKRHHRKSLGSCNVNSELENVVWKPETAKRNDRHMSIDSRVSEVTLVPSRDVEDSITPTNVSPQHTERNPTPSWIDSDLSLSKKKLISLEAEHVSSQESLSSCSGRIRKVSSSISEASSSQSNLKEVKYVKFPNDANLCLGGSTRVVVFSSGRAPFLVFSCLSFARGARTSRGDPRSDSRRRHVSGSRPLSTISDGQDPFELMGLTHYGDGVEVSYGYLLEPSQSNLRRMASEETDLIKAQITRCCSYDPAITGPVVRPVYTRISESCLEPDSLPYHPNLFEDELWESGSHRTLLTFTSYRTSVINYVKPADLKKEMNDKFREKYPQIHITLSKIRSLKREMKCVAVGECGLDLLTVAQAYVYFEKLVLQGRVQKANRKLCSGVCLILSAKLNDAKGSSLKCLLEKVETIFRVNRRELLATEFPVILGLNFALHLPTCEVQPHYQRLLYDK